MQPWWEVYCVRAYLCLSGSESTSHSGGKNSKQKNSNRIFHESHCRLPCHTSVRYVCTAGWDTTPFCRPSIRQSSMLVPRWSTALRTGPALWPPAEAARVRRSEAMSSQWRAAACRSTERSFSLSAARVRARDRRTHVSRGAGEWRTNSSRARLSFIRPHTIRLNTNYRQNKTC